MPILELWASLSLYGINKVLSYADFKIISPSFV